MSLEMSETVLRGALPGWDVLCEAGTLSEIRRKTVVLIPVNMQRVDAVRHQVTPTYAAWVLIPSQDRKDFEKNLEAALLEFLTVLEQTGQFTWSTANRGVLSETYTGFRLELITTSTIYLGEKK